MVVLFMSESYSLFTGILLLAVAASIKTGRLTIPAALTGGLLAVLLFTAAGFTGIAMMGAFFILGSAATSWKLELKRNRGLAENNKGKRKTSQVLANGGIAGIIAALMLIFPQQRAPLQLLMAASLASAAADTLSSEMGNIYGRHFYNILTFKKDQRGLDGVVSLEGTLWGLAGAGIIALIYGLGFNRDFASITVVIIAGAMGNLSDSILGALFQRRGYVNNDTVNFLNTASAALFAWLIIFPGA